MKDWKFYEWGIIKASIHVSQGENQRQAQLLAAMLVVLLMISIVVLPFWVWVDPNFLATRTLSLAILGALGTAYAVNRIGSYRLGAYILIALFPTIITVSVIVAPTPVSERMPALEFLMVSVLLASILLTARETIVLSLLCLIYVGVFLLLTGVRLAAVYPDLIYMGTISALLIVGAAVRSRYLQNLQQSEDRYRSLLEQSNDAVFIMNLDGVHIQVNQCAADMLGYQAEELIGLSFRDVVVPEQQIMSQNTFQRLRTSGERLPLYERSFRHQDGRVIPAEVNIAVVKDSDGNPLHFQSIVRDITQRKRSQEQQFTLVLEQERVQLLHQFIEKAAHEFRTPLAVINSNAFVMARLDESEKRQARFEVVQEHVKQLTRLVTMLLTMTRLESGSPAASHPVDLGLILESVCYEMDKKSRAGITVHCPEIRKLPLVMGNADDLTEALRQILDNGCRFTPADGMVTVTAGCQEQKVWVEVTDTGPGIAAEHLPFIFNTFWRLDDAHSTPGFGLGLPIARKVIDGLGGAIKVDSVVGKGTTVRITLPALTS